MRQFHFTRRNGKHVSVICPVVGAEFMPGDWSVAIVAKSANAMRRALSILNRLVPNYNGEQLGVDDARVMFHADSNDYRLWVRCLPLTTVAPNIGSIARASFLGGIIYGYNRSHRKSKRAVVS